MQVAQLRFMVMLICSSLRRLEKYPNSDYSCWNQACKYLCSLILEALAGVSVCSIAGYVKHLNLLAQFEVYALCCYLEILSLHLLFVTMAEACSNSL